MNALLPIIVAPTDSRTVDDVNLPTIQHPGLYNFKPSNLKKWRKALANVRSGTANASLVCLGDSNTTGEGAGTSTRGLNGAKAKSYPVQLAKILNTAVAPAAINSFFGSGGGGVTALGYDPRIVLGTGWSELATPDTFGGRCYTNSTTTNPLDFTPADAFDRIDVWYTVGGSNGTITVGVDGGAAITTQSTTGAAGFTKVTVNTTLGNHTVNVARSTGGGVFIVGVECYNSAVKQVLVKGSGWTASRVSNWTAGTNPYQGVNGLGFIAPDLTIINLGINDWVNGTTTTAFKTEYQKIIDKALLSGDVILTVPAPSSTAGATAANQAAISAAIYELAATNDLPVVDLTQRLNSYADANSLGFFFDTLHPNALGYADIAQLVAKALMI